MNFNNQAINLQALAAMFPGFRRGSIMPIDQMQQRPQWAMPGLRNNFGGMVPNGYGNAPQGMFPPQAMPFMKGSGGTF